MFFPKQKEKEEKNGNCMREIKVQHRERLKYRSYHVCLEIRKIPQIPLLI